jgi:hypothetical protein
VIKKDNDLANVQIPAMKEKDVDAIAVIDSFDFGAPRQTYYREKLGSATEGAGINTSLVPKARTTI